jgi:hypothetical protein
MERQLKEVFLFKRRSQWSNAPPHTVRTLPRAFEHADMNAMRFEEVSDKSSTKPALDHRIKRQIRHTADMVKTSHTPYR